MTDAEPTGAYDLHVERERLIGGSKRGWVARCREVVSTNGAVRELRDALADSGAEYEALYESSDMQWARTPLGPDRIGDDLTPELATAQVLTDLAAALIDESPADDALREALLHFDFSGVQSTGTQLLPGDSPLTIGGGKLATMVLTLLGAVDHPSRGFVMLLLCELSGRRPQIDRKTAIPVLFRTADNAGTRGEAGTLTLTVLESGPSGLHPDPAVMTFLQADPDVGTGIEAAWAVSELALTGACVVWSVTTGENVPSVKIDGDSMSAAFAVALDDIAARHWWTRRRRLRTLDRSCAVTAGLNGTTLTEVGGYPDKTRAARAHGYRVVVAKNALKRARDGAPPDWVVQISGAETVDEAIAETRSVINKPLYATGAALVVAVIVIITGVAVGMSKIDDAQRARLATQLASSANANVNSDSRIAALLALTADRLHSSPTTRAAMRSVTDNNESVAASATAGDSSVDYVAAMSGLAMTSNYGSSTVRAWALPGLKPIGTLNLGGRVAGMGGGGYAQSGVIAVLAGSNLKIFQGAGGTMPTQVASFRTPFDDPDSKIFGPFVDASSNTVIAFDNTFRGIYWTPGMQVPDTFDLSGKFAPRTALVAVSNFGRRNGSNASAQLSRDTAGSSVLLGSSDRAVYELRVEAAPGQPATAADPRQPIGGSIRRVYDANPVVQGVDSPIFSLAISPQGSTLVGTDAGLEQFERETTGSDDEIEPDMDRVIKTRVTAIVPTAMFADEVSAVTPDGLAYVDGSRVTPLTNIDPTATVQRSIRSIAMTPDGTVLVGRADGRIVLHDPSQALTRLRDRWGATAMRFTGQGQLARTYVLGTGSNLSAGVAVGDVSRETEAQAKLKELAGTDSTTTSNVTEDVYKLPDDTRRFEFGVDAAANRVAATGMEGGRSYVWIWNRQDPGGKEAPARILSFPGEPSSADITDVGQGLALSPDGDRVYAFNSGRGLMTAWAADDGHVLWNRQIPVSTDTYAPPRSRVTFDQARRHALIDHFDTDGNRTHTVVDLETGAATKLTGLADVNDTFLSPSGTAIVASKDNEVTVFDLQGGSRPTVARRSNAVNLGAIIGAIAWSPDEKRFAVDLFGTGQVAFVSATKMDEDGPRWRMNDFGPNDLVAGLAWSPDGHYIAINVSTNIRDEQARTDSVRVLLADDTDLTANLCNIAGSDWTAAEWKKYVGSDTDQFRVCG